MIPADRLTVRAGRALQVAAELARSGGNPAVEDMHLLAGLLAEEDGIVEPVLRKVGAEPSRIRSALEESMGRLPRQTGAAPAASRELTRVVDEADAEARRMDDLYVSTEHILVALASKQASSTRQILANEGATQEALREALSAVRGPHQVTDQEAEGKYRALERFGVDLTERARAGELDPVIGRDSEIRRVMQVLSRRTKNNPVLIG
ncbi:MAG: type VI secretion system ATPase TssH, partial [Gemmatimonadetes bacterium]|nr:type VI secretion system ATPase TssH [Gemmatimonadota bacterium]